MTRGSVVVTAFLVVLAPILDCARPERGHAPAAPASAVAKRPAEAARPDAGHVGSTCNAPDRFTHGTCREGLLCAPLPGGYCLSFCPCSDGAVCVPTTRIGEICARPCSSNADCRTGEGYLCDPDYKGCIFPRLKPSPVLSACHAPELPRRSFGVVTQLSTSAAPGTYQYEPSAALTARGDLVVLYTAGSPFGTTHALATSVVRVDGRVERDRTFTSNRRNHFDPWITAGRNGDIHAVWLGFDSALAPEQRAIIGFAQSTEGITWSAAAVADDAEGDCPNETPGCLDKPMIVAGPDPADRKKEILYVLYLNEPDRGTRVVRSTDGGKTFSKSTQVTPSDDMYGASVSDSGVLHVVFRTDNPAGFEYVRSSDGGRSFTAPRVVSAPGELAGAGGFSNPQIVADDRRSVLYAAYPSGGVDGRWDIALAISTDGGSSWRQTKVNDDAPCANHMMPMATLDPSTGRVHLVWLVGSGNSAGPIPETLAG